jgi:hypothetical protein
MDADDVVTRRLLAQHLWGPPAADPAAALRAILAVQSQEFPYARWSLAQRTADASAEPVDAAFAAGTILRTHVLRPTWHFVHRDDLRWLLTLSAPRVLAGSRGRHRELGIDDATAERSNALLAGAVAGGRHRTREELAAVLTDAGLLDPAGGKLRAAPVHRQRLGHLVMRAELDMVLVSGAPRRSGTGTLLQTYAAFDERVPPLPAGFDREYALGELVRRYFAGHGPASVKDCAAWSGLTQADIKQGLAYGGSTTGDSGLARVAVDGVEMFFSQRGWTGEPAAGPRADLIQCYDEYVMGYTQTRHYLDGMAPAPASATVPSHVVLLDGRMVGNWKHTSRQQNRQQSATIVLQLRRELRRDEPAALAAAVERYEAFLDLPAEVVWT